MRIAQVAPLHESVPPRAYGGTERIVALLTEALVEAGHDLTLYATRDSKVHCRVEDGHPQGLRDDPNRPDPLGPHYLMLEKVVRDAPKYDFIHFHTDFLHFPFIRRLSTPHVTTLHGRLDLPGLRSLFQEYSEAPLISISNSQRRPAPDANWISTVYHGIDPGEFSLSHPKDGYLGFLGRISPEKGPDKAIEIARRVGMPIKLAAKVDPVDREYFHEVVEPLLDGEQAQYIGEVGPQGKAEFLQGATALLFPIAWPEPFGLVMIESMACGTPVIAWNRGSVPEVIDDGETGFIVHNDDEAVDALARCRDFDRRRCRQRFEERYLTQRMMQDYLSIYERLIAIGKGCEAVA